MVGIWLIDKNSYLMPSLVGNFATRAFASFHSFKNLVTFETTQVANLVLIVSQGLDVQIHVVETWFQNHLPTVPRVYVGYSQSIENVDILSEHLSTQELVDEVTVRLEKGAGSCLIFKDLWLERSKHRFRVVGQELDVVLSPKESLLMQLFMQTPSHCISRKEIQNTVWDGRVVSPRTIDSHISRIRRHLEDSEVVIESIYGDGYVMR